MQPRHGKTSRKDAGVSTLNIIVVPFEARYLPSSAMIYFKLVGKRCATSEDLSVRTPEPGPRAGTNSESGTNRQNGVGSEWQAGNIPESLQQSFATRANASNGAAAARFPSIFAADFCNMRTPMFTGLSAMMQSLPVMRQ